jgi:DNA-binding NarL/FixJ family response regulator
MVADDQNLVRQGLCSLLALSDRIEVAGTVSNGAEVVHGLRRHQPDLLLLDIRMPVVNGIEALRTMAEHGCMVPTIILTTFDDDEMVLRSMNHGARGFLLKDTSLETLVNAIICVHEGGTWVQPALTERMLKGLASIERTFDSHTEPEALSEKEVELLRLMAGGYSNREIAHAVHKSEGTVKNQISSILNKLGVRDRTRAVLRAVDLGLLR